MTLPDLAAKAREIAAPWRPYLPDELWEAFRRMLLSALTEADAAASGRRRWSKPNGGASDRA